MDRQTMNYLFVKYSSAAAVFTPCWWPYDRL